MPSPRLDRACHRRESRHSTVVHRWVSGEALCANDTAERRDVVCAQCRAPGAHLWATPRAYLREGARQRGPESCTHATTRTLTTDGDWLVPSYGCPRFPHCFARSRASAIGICPQMWTVRERRSNSLCSYSVIPRSELARRLRASPVGAPAEQDSNLGALSWSQVWTLRSGPETLACSPTVVGALRWAEGRDRRGR